MYFLLVLRGALRMALLGILLGVGVLLVLLASFIPGRIQGVRVPAYVVWAIARLSVWIFGITYVCSDPALVQNHQGFIFCNHTSFLDTLMILHLTPARFLSTKGVRKLPIIGQLAVALETIFVNRYTDEGRAASRVQIAQQLRASTYPPLALFPEGKIGPGHTVLPFRYGAFEIAQQENIPILPCVLVYQPLAVFSWYEKSDNLITMAWRLVTQPGKVQARLIPLTVIAPQTNADVAALAQQVQQEIQATLSAAYGQQ
ncbi:MAG: lysophospholipid acyltransferase family protein [Caldilineaceae bacterium]